MKFALFICADVLVDHGANYKYFPIVLGLLQEPSKRPNNREKGKWEIYTEMF